MTDFGGQLQALDWARMRDDLDRQGWATTAFLPAPSCGALDELWHDEAAFRKTVVMERHAFGQGLYKYWRDPLPLPVAALRRALYDALMPLAETWRGRLDDAAPPYPAAYADYRARCREAGQALPTPLLLRYQAGGYNCLHQDLYGAELFPVQAAILLSRPGVDFSGGEFVLVEQRGCRSCRWRKATWWRLRSIIGRPAGRAAGIARRCAMGSARSVPVLARLWVLSCMTLPPDWQCSARIKPSPSIFITFSCAEGGFDGGVLADLSHRRRWHG